MKKTSFMILAMLAAETSSAAPPAPSHTELQKGYVCTVSRSSFGIARRGVEATLAFNLTTEPECKGEWLAINYACSSSPRAAINIGFCARSASFSTADQAMIQDQLLHAAARNVPVDVVRGPCLSDDPVETCFVLARVYNVPYESADDEE